MDDASLVAAALGGDGAAWAAIYDRYADRLHDHCHRILHDRDEAADALHDAFIAASHNLAQLRDPSRLRPWLYSICRHEALRRAEQRSRVDLTDGLDEMTIDEVDFGREARVEELQALVWAAAAGLNPRDQALLDLNLRQGLEGQDLADAMGTSLNNSYVMLSRLRDQVERSLGALLIARLGREDCVELDDLLVGWDGRFSPVLRKRVARHVDACEVCREQRGALVSPLALLAAFPLVPAPTSLRDRVLHGIGGDLDAVPISFTSTGFATASPGTDRTRSRGILLGAVAAVVLVIVGLFIVQLGDDDPSTELTAADATTTTSEEKELEEEDEPTSSTSSSSSTSSTSSSSTTSSSTTSTTSTSTTVPPVVVPPTAPPTTAVTTTTTAPPSDTTDPTIGSLSSSASELSIQSCTGGSPHMTTITATITDTSAVTAVLHWSGGQANMDRSASTYSGSFGNFSTPRSVTYYVVATDAAGNQARSAERAIQVDPCPQ